MMRVIGSDFLFWIASRVAREQMIKTVLATPPKLLKTASAAETARINAMQAVVAALSKDIDLDYPPADPALVVMAQEALGKSVDV